ncbi:MAG: Spy/CpxP family protein refolding chaperone [Rhodocyclaceae bacterium]
MKLNTRAILVALAVLGLSTGGAAHAFRGEGNCGGAMKGQAAEKYVGSRLKKLHTDLKLTADQEAGWKTWSAPMQQRAASMKERRPDFSEMSKLPAPERMEKMLERMKEHQKEMEVGVAATRSFYATLTPEQRQVFDRFSPMGDHARGRGGKAGRG